MSGGGRGRIKPVIMILPMDFFGLMTPRFFVLHAIEQGRLRIIGKATMQDPDRYDNVACTAVSANSRLVTTLGKQ